MKQRDAEGPTSRTYLSFTPIQSQPRRIDDTTLRRQGLRRGRSNLGPGQAVMVDAAHIARLFGRELEERLGRRGNGDKEVTHAGDR